MPDQSRPEPELVPAAELTESTEPTESTEDDADVPLNRAARRAKAKQTDPSHVGPRGGATVRSGRGPRSHTKRH